MYPMHPMYRLVVPLLLAYVLLPVGCGSTKSSLGGNGSTGGNGGNGGSLAGMGGASGGGGATSIGASGLPAVPAVGGVAKPGGAPGDLTILSWAGFKGAVTYTFDDSNASQIQHYADLNGMGVPLTFFLITGKAESSDPVWKQAIKDGHEISNHTMSHAQIGTGDDIDAATTFLMQTLGVTAYDMAAPYGNASYEPLAMTRFLLNRGVADCLIGSGSADATDPYNLCCYIGPTGATASAYNGEIDAAQTAGKWRIVLVHGFAGGTDGAYQPVSIDEFTASVAHARSLGNLWIDTMINVGAYWRAQKVIAAVAPTSSGDTKTWTWTLPAHYPPGKYLRVSVAGGTVSQGGQTLTWNDQGYYEIALDAGSLTVAP
jgi:hypothetical protein